MDLKQAISHLLNGETVLFLGSGFSAGATKADGKEFCTATPLAHKLLQDSGFEPQEYINDLGSASEIYQDVKGEHK